MRCYICMRITSTRLRAVKLHLVTHRYTYYRAHEEDKARNGFYKAHRVDDERDGTMLVVWQGRPDPEKKKIGWPPTYEPIASVSKGLKDPYRRLQNTLVSIKVNTDALRNAASRSIARRMKATNEFAFGLCLTASVEAIQDSNTASYVLNQISEETATPIVMRCDPTCKHEVTYEVTITDPKKIGDFCRFEEFYGDGCIKSMRYNRGRKMDTGILVVAFLQVRYYNNRSTEGLVTFEIEFQTVKINGETGSCQPPHLPSTTPPHFLKVKENLDWLVQYARGILPEHPLRTKGWCNLPFGHYALADAVAMPSCSPAEAR